MKVFYDISVLAMICMICAGCGTDENESRKQQKVPLETDDVTPSTGSDRTEMLLQAAQRDLQSKTRELNHAHVKTERLTSDLRNTQDKLLQQAQDLQQMGKQAQAAQSQLQSVQKELLRVSQLWRLSEQERVSSQKTVEEWNAFYKEYEAQIQEYEAYIQSQDKVIRQLASELGTEIAQDQPPQRVPDRLVPSATQAISRRQFFSIVQGMTTDELRNYIGAPSAITGSAPQYYVYNRGLTYAYDKNKKDSSVKISIENGRVKQCFFSE